MPPVVAAKVDNMRWVDVALLPSLTTSSATVCLTSCMAATRVSTVPSVSKRYTVTGRVWTGKKKSRHAQTPHQQHKIQFQTHLAQPVRTVGGLKVHERVPRVLHENNRVSGLQNDKKSR